MISIFNHVFTCAHLKTQPPNMALCPPTLIPSPGAQYAKYRAMRAAQAFRRSTRSLDDCSKLSASEINSCGTCSGSFSSATPLKMSACSMDWSHRAPKIEDRLSIYSFIYLFI